MNIAEAILEIFCSALVTALEKVEEVNNKREPKFKVGNRVKYEGKIYKIDKLLYCDTRWDGFCYHLEPESLGCIKFVVWKLEGKLEKVEEEKPEPKFKVGDRVRLLSHFIDAWELGERKTTNVGTVENILDHGILVHFEICGIVQVIREIDLEKVEEEKPEVCSKCGNEVGTIAFYNEPDTANRFCSFGCAEEKDEWTYPCVVQSISDPTEVYIAIMDGPNDSTMFQSQKSLSKSRMCCKKENFKVIATELRNLE